MNWKARVSFIFLLTVALIAGAQHSKENLTLSKETQSNGYWVDPSTGMMWAAKDNGKDVNWHKASNYCRDLRLAGYSDWRLANIGELGQIYDSSANAPGRAGPGKGRAFTWHIKGNLYLTGNQWSSTRTVDDCGHPTGYAWRYDFNEGRPFAGDEIRFYTNKRALCVRQTASGVPIVPR